MTSINSQLNTQDEHCQICGEVRNIDRHHIVLKGMGGSKNPMVLAEENLITLCRSCHQKIHEHIWRIEREDNSLRVFDEHTGEQVMRRQNRPDFDAPSLFQTLNMAEHSLSFLFEALQYLSDDQLVEAYGCSRSLGKRSWLIEAAILYEAQQRSAYNDHALEGIARRFEISLRHAQKYALVWKTFFAPYLEKEENVNVDAFFLDEPSWYVVTATETTDPHRWLAYAQDRKAQDPRYSVFTLRRDIQYAKSLEGMTDPSQPNELGLDDITGLELWRECPWIRLYCVCSGRPVPVGKGCDRCEFRWESEKEKLPNEPTDLEEEKDVRVI